MSEEMNEQTFLPLSPSVTTSQATTFAYLEIALRALLTFGALIILSQVVSVYSRESPLALLLIVASMATLQKLNTSMRLRERHQFSSICSDISILLFWLYFISDFGCDDTNTIIVTTEKACNHFRYLAIAVHVENTLLLMCIFKGLMQLLLFHPYTIKVVEDDEAAEPPEEERTRYPSSRVDRALAAPSQLSENFGERAARNILSAVQILLLTVGLLFNLSKDGIWVIALLIAEKTITFQFSPSYPWMGGVSKVADTVGLIFWTSATVDMIIQYQDAYSVTRVVAEMSMLALLASVVWEEN